MYAAMCAKNRPVNPAVAASTETPTATRPRWVRSTSRNGCRDASCFIRANSGDSSSERRSDETQQAAEPAEHERDAPAERRARAPAAARCGPRG